MELDYLTPPSLFNPTFVQVGLEYLLVDSRTFITNEDAALRTFFGATVDSSTSYRVEIEVWRVERTCTCVVVSGGGVRGPF